MRLTGYALFLLCSAAVPAQPPGRPAVVEPTATVRIPVEGALAIKDFVAGPQGFYFLAASESEAVVLRTDVRGTQTGRMVLPSSTAASQVRALRLDGAGGGVVLESGSFAKLLVLDATGVRKELTILRAVADVAYLRDDLAVIDSSTSELLWPDTDIPGLLLSPAVTGSAMMFPVGPDLMAIVEGTDARLRLVTRDRTLLPAVTLSAPELEGRIRRRDGGVAQPLLRSAAAATDGRIFVLATDYRPADGALVLEYDLQANLAGDFHLRLPEGMVPSKLVIHGDSIVLASLPGGMLAIYPLPPAPRRR